MNKKLVVLFAGLLFGAALNGCQFILTNNSDFPVSVTNLQDKNFETEHLGRNISRQIGSADARAHFKFTYQSKEYEFQQLACTPSHRVQMSVMNIVHGNFDTQMFKVESGEKRYYK